MVKIGVIFMPFSNPTCHFRDTAGFTSSTYSTYSKVNCVSEMASRIWKWHENDTYFHHQFYLKNANMTVPYITGTYFFRRWPEFMYRTRAIITRSRFETALDYKPRIFKVRKVSLYSKYWKIVQCNSQKFFPSRVIKSFPCKDDLPRFDYFLFNFDDFWVFTR